MPFDLTAILNEWGVTLGLLSVAASAFFVLFLIGMREFLFWFLRIHAVLKTQRELIAEVHKLKRAIEFSQDIHHVKSAMEPSFPLKEAASDIKPKSLNN